MKIRNLTTGIYEGSFLLLNFPGVSALNRVQLLDDDGNPLPDYADSGHEYSVEYSDDELKQLSMMGDIAKYPLSDSDTVTVDRYRIKYTGEAYADTGVIIPFTARAADAFMQVNAGLNLAVQQGVDPSTLMSVLSFDNGSKLPVAVEAATINGVECHKFADVAIWFYNMRNSFYQNT